MPEISGEPFPLEELVSDAPDAAREAYLERSAAFEAGDLVRVMRDKAGLTQKELALRISTSQSHLSEIERGNGLQGPTFSMLRKIAVACKVELRIDVQPASFQRIISDMGMDQRRVVAEALEVSVDDAPRALLASRERAMATLQVGNLTRLLQNGLSGIRDLAYWVRHAPMS